MYSLSLTVPDQVGLPNLKELAEQHIYQQLSLTSIVDEMFSRFRNSYAIDPSHTIQLLRNFLSPNRYDVILNAQMKYLVEGSGMTQVMPKIQEYVRYVVQGKMPHAEAVMILLLSRLSPELSKEPVQDNLGNGYTRDHLRKVSGLAYNTRSNANVMRLEEEEILHVNIFSSFFNRNYIAVDVNC